MCGKQPKWEDAAQQRIDRLFELLDDAYAGEMMEKPPPAGLPEVPPVVVVGSGNVILVMDGNSPRR